MILMYTALHVDLFQPCKIVREPLGARLISKIADRACWSLFYDF